MIEEYLRRALLLSGGDPTTLVTHPISAYLLAVCALMLLFVLLPSVRRSRDVAFEEEA